MAFLYSERDHGWMINTFNYDADSGVITDVERKYGLRITDREKDITPGRYEDDQLEDAMIHSRKMVFFISKYMLYFILSFIIITGNNST